MASFKEAYGAIDDILHHITIIPARCSGKTMKLKQLNNATIAVPLGLEVLDNLLDLIELVDDEHGYGITIKGLYTFKSIPKEVYDQISLAIAYRKATGGFEDDE